MQQLLREIRERGYPGSSNLLVRYLNQGRADSDRPHMAPRKATQILLTRPDNLTDGQRETAARLSSACPEMTEGVNNKTKMIKRQMFGRAGFELLRHRILLG